MLTFGNVRFVGGVYILPNFTKRRIMKTLSIFLLGYEVFELVRTHTKDIFKSYHIQINPYSSQDGQ